MIVNHQRPQYTEFQALRSISFDVTSGQVFGVIGRNGSGKSTLLRLIAGIYKPTTGRLTTRGRVSALLELGAGFDPELTGYENIFFNGAIFGMSRRAMREYADDIIDFSGLHDFLHTPIKFYSRGMYARLGFSVAILLPTEILLVDEILSVGDEEFQRKSNARIEEVVRDGRTVIFVSHTLEAVEKLCDRALWLDHGETIEEGVASDVIRNYLSTFDV
jgi:ABC-type polysaccharide/polyol phosphate transport system ATPase subunit